MGGRDDAEMGGGDRRGDERAFGTFYRRLVLRWCVRETGDRELAADLRLAAAAPITASPSVCRRLTHVGSPIGGPHGIPATGRRGSSPLPLFRLA